MPAVPKVSYSQPVNAATGQPASISEARARAIDDTAFGRSLVEKHGRRLDLRALIDSRLPHRLNFNQDTRALEAWSSVSESVRQRCGEAANGTWLPLSAFRDLTVGTASAGGHTVTDRIATGAAAGSLLPQSAIFNAGCTVLSGLRGGTFTIPVADLAGDGSDSWVDSENGEGPERSLAFSSVSLPARTVTAYVDISRSMLLQSSLDITGLAMTELGRQLARAVDVGAINGSGSSHQPLGLLSNSDVTLLEAGANGGAPTYAHLVAAERELNKVHTGTRTWLTSPELAAKLRLTSRVAGQPQFLLEGREMLGHEVRISPSVPATLTKGTGTGLSALILLDPAELVVAIWGASAVDLIVDPYQFSREGRVRVIATMTVGIGVRRPAAVALFKDLATA